MSLRVVGHFSVGSLFDMCIGLVAHLLLEIDLCRKVIAVILSWLLLLLSRMLLLDDYVRVHLVYLN